MGTKWDKLKFEKWVMDSGKYLSVPKRDIAPAEIIWKCPLCGNVLEYSLLKTQYLSTFTPTCPCGHVGTKVFHKQFYIN